MDFNSLWQVFNKSQHSAGPRYTPAMDPDAPNLTIEPLQRAISGLICGNDSKQYIESLKKDLAEKFNKAHILKHEYSLHFRYPKEIINDLQRLSEASPNNSTDLINRLVKRCLRHQKTISSLSMKLWELENNPTAKLNKKHQNKAYNSTKISITNAQSELRQYQNQIEGIIHFIKSPACKFINNNFGLLVGEWGSGKTHFLCDYTKYLLNCRKPALLLLAKDLAGESARYSIVGYTQLAKSFTALVNQLNRLGKKESQRALLIIDGINEANNHSWQTELDEIIVLLKTKPYVGLIISCRSPSHKNILSESIRQQAITLTHHGFDEIEFDAQTEFFRYYQIPLPEVPLLADEFSKPLTLKIMCSAFKTLPKKSQAKGFDGISSGQKGMTYVLEKFIRQVSRPIENKFKLRRNTCWEFIKGRQHSSTSLCTGMAPYMAQTMRDFIPLPICIDILLNQPHIPNRKIACQLYEALVDEGVLQEDEYWQSEEADGVMTIVRLPYQRFSDHIIARHLLGEHLDTSSELSIRRSLYKNKPIGRIFNFSANHTFSYDMPSWAEAIVVEFPERVKDTLSKKPKELIYYLPNSRKLIRPYADIFISGLFWRSPKSFCHGTSKFCYHLLWKSGKHFQQSLFEALVTLATKYKHPYNAFILYRQLEQLTISDRDLSWSEFIREAYSSTAIERLLLWFEHKIPENIELESARNLIVLISMILTSTDRVMRDRATKVLVLLGEKYPKALFEITLKLLAFNDFYVPERLLAASYGVSMSLWHNHTNHQFRNSVVPFARQLITYIFSDKAILSTTHSLIIDYALGIIHIAQLVKPRCIATQQIKLIRHPYPEIKSCLLKATKLSDKQQANVDHAIHMDFGNYTLGRICLGRGNYQYNHPSYKYVRSLIDWRILNLGYDSERYKNVDSAITHQDHHRRQNNYGKIDRYGKKYSWIAYFETYGFLNITNQLEREYREPRPTDADIDPSFPESPPTYPPITSAILTRGPKADVAWLNEGGSPHHRNYHCRRAIDDHKGPWILLDGYINSGTDDLREFFSFIYGFFVAPGDVKKIKAAYKKLERPSDIWLSDHHDTYTYAGEACWSNNFGFNLRDQKGNLIYRAQEYFSHYETVSKVEPINQGWKEFYQRTGTTIPSCLFMPMFDEIQDSETEALKESCLNLIEIINQALPEKEHINIDCCGDRFPTVTELRQGYRTVMSAQQVGGIMMTPASWSYNWEPHHSKMNQDSGFVYPHPAVCETLNLQSSARQIELVDAQGNKASIFREAEGVRFNNSSFCYLRKDLLDSYLDITGQSLIWLTWGERCFNYKKYEHRPDDEQVLHAMQNGNNIYRHFTLYEP